MQDIVFCPCLEGASDIVESCLIKLLVLAYCPTDADNDLVIV